jgi:hypothetical protein
VLVSPTNRTHFAAPRAPSAQNNGDARWIGGVNALAWLVFGIGGERRLLTPVASSASCGGQGTRALDRLCEHAGSGDVPEMPGTTEHEDLLRLNCVAGDFFEGRGVARGLTHSLFQKPRKMKWTFCRAQPAKAVNTAVKPVFAVFSEI